MRCWRLTQRAPNGRAAARRATLGSPVQNATEQACSSDHVEGGAGVLAAMTIERIGWHGAGTTDQPRIDVVTRAAPLARSQSEEDTRADRQRDTFLGERISRRR